MTTSSVTTSSAATGKTVLATEVEALLDYWGGLEDYHRDIEWRQTLIRHFEFNLRRMIHLSDAANVPMVVVDPAANLRDCPPFKSERSVILSTDDSDRFQQLIAESVETSKTDRDRTIAILERAIAIDPKHAGTHFRLASHYTDAGRDQKAKQHFQLALEEDVCPLRIIQPLNQIIQKVVAETETPCVQVRRKFEELSDGGIPGENLFFDHVHPTFHGHQVVAAENAKTLMSLTIIKPDESWPNESWPNESWPNESWPNESWEVQRDKLFGQHWKSLEPVYFERGKQRLRALKSWATGRSDKLHHGAAAK